MQASQENRFGRLAVPFPDQKMLAFLSSVHLFSPGIGFNSTFNDNNNREEMSLRVHIELVQYV